MEILFRRNTVLEALRANRRHLVKLWLQKDHDAKTLAPILAEAKKRGVKVETADKQKLGHLAQDSGHQGLALEVGPYPYSTLPVMLRQAAPKGEKPFLLLLDLLHGPQNIGALFRMAEICRVHWVVLQDRRASEITPAVVMYSTGAAEHLYIAQKLPLPYLWTK